MFISIGKVATIVGVAVSTLRRWDNEGKLQAEYKTIGKYRRYNLTTITKYSTTGIIKQPVTMNTFETAIVYCRVSGSKQKKDLETQQLFLEQFVQQKHWLHKKTYKDIGSGLKDTRKGLLRMLRELPIIQPTYLVSSYPDRLARFGLAIVEQVCQLHNVTIIKAKQEEQILSLDQQLVSDVLAMLTSFAGKLHRTRRGTFIQNQ